MICFRDYARPSLYFTLLSCTIFAVTACGSGVTLDGDDWTEDTHLEQDSDTSETDISDAYTDTSNQNTEDTSQLDTNPNNTDPNDTGNQDTTPTENPFENLPAVYPSDRTLSPITPYIAHHLRTIADKDPSLHNDVFAKIGDSLTVNTGFMHCFSSTTTLNTHPDLQPALDHFRAGNAGSTNPFIRESHAAAVGWNTSHLLAAPSPLDAELSATAARYGLVMLGTNDIGNGSGNIYTYGANLLTIADQMLAAGTIPLLTSIPPRTDNPDADHAVPRFNAVARAVAQSRQIPFIDLTTTWNTQPERGLLNDGIHLNSFQQGCNFNETGLKYGHNARNLATIQQLSRLHALLTLDAPAPDPPGEPLHGDGSSSDPILIPSLPFVDARNTGTAGQSVINTYPGCAAAQNESGNEFIYRFHTERPVRVRAFVIVRTPTDVDVHLLDQTATGAGCLARNDREIIHDLSPGTYHFALDTFVSANGRINSGEYLFVLLEE